MFSEWVFYESIEAQKRDSTMDQVKTGLYIAEKRKQKNMTQAMLAEQMHVSKNAVSKWERGMNLPEVSSMPQLCQILGITLNELFAGEDIKEEVLPFTADQNLLEALQNSSFSLQERIAYFKRKWRKEHLFDCIISVIGWCVLMVVLYIRNKDMEMILTVGALVALIMTVVMYNRMRAYIESNAFGRWNEKTPR